MEKQEVMIINPETIRDKIYVVRGQKVMLDFELAELYGYTTSRFNEQVTNNIAKFDADFMFKLKKEEFRDLISEKSTSSWGGRRKLPRAFTEQGIYMLMTVLKGELAISQSKALIRTFRAMKNYIIDNYISLKTLVLMKSVPAGIGIVLFSDNLQNGLHSTEFADFKKEYPAVNIKMQITKGRFHDRYIILDYDKATEKIYHCGASSKDAGVRVTTISEVVEKEVYHDLIDEILQYPPLKLK